MDNKEFSSYRKKIDKTQKQLAQLLGTSVKAVHSYEQGWRSIPTHVERQLLFLISRMNKCKKKCPPCWVLKRCSNTKKTSCPAWEFRTGDLCWLINGAICEGSVKDTWNEKMKICRSCEVLISQMSFCS